MRRIPRPAVIPLATACLVSACLAGCATQTALMTREERLGIARRGPAEFAAPAHVEAPAARSVTALPPRTVIATAQPRPQTGGNARRDAALPGEERGVADQYYVLRRFRDANTRLAAALAAYDRDPSKTREEQAHRAFDAYQESAKMSRMTAVVVALSLTGLTGCNTISSQIRALNAEEKEVVERATAYQEHRKSIVALVAALEQVKRDGGTSKSEHALDEARARYEHTADKL